MHEPDELLALGVSRHPSLITTRSKSEAMRLHARVFGLRKCTAPSEEI